VVTRSGGPVYLQVADALRAEIREGRYQPGDLLPSVERLRATWQTSHRTIRAAVEQLRTEGLVVSRQGVGTQVREQKVSRRLTSDMTVQGMLRGWYRAVERQGLRPVSETRVRQEPCPAKAAEFLGVGEGAEVWVRDRVMRIEGEPPELLATSYFPLWVTEQAPRLRDPGQGGQITWLEEAFGPLYWHDVITARMPDPRERDLLDLAQGVPVVIVNGPTFDQEGRALTHIVMVVASDRLELSYQYGNVPADS